MITRPFGYDPATGAREIFHYDETTDQFHIETVTDVQPILDANRTAWNDFSHKRTNSWKGDGFHKVASVPIGVYMEKLVKTGRIRDKEAMKAWLNDPENRVFRTRPGRV